LDTGVFDENRYFDVFVEYAKASPEDILIQVTVHNRGPAPAALHLLPTLWFRNVWMPRPDIRPRLRQLQDGIVGASDPGLGERFLYVDGGAELLFTENDTNTARLVGVPNATPYVKDAINEYVVHSRKSAVNPERTGTKVAALYLLGVAAGASQAVRLRLTD